MKRIMIDLETLGVGVNACVVQIGACDFNGENPFKVNVSAEDAVKNGAVIDASTVMWWLAQSESARRSILVPGAPEREAFAQLNAYLADADEVWSHATFDFVIINNVMHRLDIKPKFSFRSARDIRTLNALAKGKVDVTKAERQGTHHDALDDAIYQAQYCTIMLNALGVKT